VTVPGRRRWDNDEAGRAAMIGLLYEGPWERAVNWLRAIDPETGDIRREVPDGSLRDRLANWCGRQDAAWQLRYARDGCRPPGRWRRRGLS
jgi:hypothetical protein